jgi:cob(I)alamin adenosyltransferase
MTLSGRIAFRDIEMGVWVLEGDDGRTYLLAGGDRKLKRDGQRVEVDGEVDPEALSAAMVGPVLRVRRYRFL